MVNRKDVVLWNVLFGSGGMFTIMVSTLVVTNLSNSGKWLYLLICSVSCFICAHLSLKIQDDQEISKAASRQFISLGFASLLLAAGFIWANSQEIQNPDWMNYLLYFSIAIYFAVYRIIFVTAFPKSKEFLNAVTQDSNDPLENLPQDLHNLVEKGKDIVAKTTLNTTTICALLLLVSVFFLGELNSPLTFMGVEVLAAIVIIIIARYIASYQWQKQARQSGIPEKTLESAAKLAGLPWLHIKEN